MTTANPEASQKPEAVEGGNPGPLDLVYVCGNKFLALNSTRSTVHLTYRVVGGKETGGGAVPAGPGWTFTGTAPF